MFKSLQIVCNRCSQTFETTVKQTTPPFHGHITKSLWCPCCKGAISLKYKFDQENTPLVLSMIDPGSASLFQPSVPEGGLTARPRSK